MVEMLYTQSEVAPLVDILKKAGMKGATAVPFDPEKAVALFRDPLGRRTLALELGFVVRELNGKEFYVSGFEDKGIPSLRFEYAVSGIPHTMVVPGFRSELPDGVTVGGEGVVAHYQF